MLSTSRSCQASTSARVYLMEWTDKLSQIRTHVLEEETRFSEEEKPGVFPSSIASWLDGLIGHAEEWGRLLQIDPLATDQTVTSVLSDKLDEVRQEERHRIGEEVHHEIGSPLSGVTMWLRSVIEELEEGGTSDEDIQWVLRNLKEIRTNLAEVNEEVRRLSHRSESDRYQGDDDLAQALETTLRQFRPRGGCTLSLAVPDPAPELSSEQTHYLTQIVREALTNALKHADPTAVGVTVTADRDTVHLSVQDDGEGFEKDTDHGGFGLAYMREQARMIGGELTIETSEDGTTVTCSCPSDGIETS